MEDNSHQIEVLIIDDDPNIAQSMSFILEDEGYNCTVANDGTSGIEKLKKRFYNIMLIDFQLPDMTGLDVAKKARSINEELCAIMITGHATLESAVNAIKEEIYDYLIKPVDPDQLKRAIEKALEKQMLSIQNKQLIKELKEINKKLSELSVTDDLTRIFNRREFYRRLTTEVARSARLNHNLSVLLFDVDGFKHFNDSYGHLKGDLLLRDVGDIISQSLREYDSGYRYGGDEFVVILPETKGEQATVVAERISKCFLSSGFEGTGLSIGIAQYVPGEDVNNLVKRADEAMYKAKKSGGSKISLNKGQD